jgi:hypothetical protein
LDGAITFHARSPNLTRVLMVLEYHPKGPFEHTGNGQAGDDPEGDNQQGDEYAQDLQADPSTELTHDQADAVGVRAWMQDRPPRS